MATTYLTIKQSMKRGMMPAADPSNPMANSQKYMTYIMPFFALTGLYWPFGLVLYWCTTNVWTLGQQYILGIRYPYTPPAPVDGDSTPAVTRGSRPASASALTAGGSRGSRPNGRTAPAGRTPAGRASANGAANASGSGNGSGGVLKRLSKRAEPEPEPAAPEVKIVRHQTQRQSRSKRSGKR
jgi:YidC/Oxa1 family membrane protein insertase